MQIIISPSKSQDFSQENFDKKNKAKVEKNFSESFFLKESQKISKIFKNFSPKDLEKMMKISQKLGELNFSRFQKWSQNFSKIKCDKNGEYNFLPSIFAFTGDVYSGFDLENWDKKDFKNAEKKLKIISGFYGVLTPLNFLKAYRLEMGTKISFEINKKKYKNLYDFWEEKITDYFLEVFKNKKNKILINLASVEYSKVLDRKILEKKGVKFLDVDFKVLKNGKISSVAIYAKKARGQMANWIIKKNIEEKKDIKNFSEGGWKFSAKNSLENRFVFILEK